MPVQNRNVVKKIIKARGLEGCEMCGSRKPNLANRGLHVSHVASNSVGGKDDEANLLVLCPSCADAFDLVLKPKIWRALQVFGGVVPANWRDAEGRMSKDDRVV